MRYQNRIEAAQRLLPLLKKYSDAPDTVVLAIPRGALQIGAVLARELHLPLDIVVTKKIPAPGNEEYAIGAIAPDGEILLNEEMVRMYALPEGYLKGVAGKLMTDIERRYHTYRAKRSSGEPVNSGLDSMYPDLAGKTVILTDDGIATGFTMKAAIEYLYRQKVKKIIVAVPVSSPDSAEEIKKIADEFVCPYLPAVFSAVAQFYDEFPQVSDEEAAQYLN